MVAGNFNLTNGDELNLSLVERGQHPVFDTDTQAILEEAGYYLDAANDQLAAQAESEGIPGPEVSKWIGERLDFASITNALRIIQSNIDIESSLMYSSSCARTSNYSRFRLTSRALTNVIQILDKTNIFSISGEA